MAINLRFYDTSTSNTNKTYFIGVTLFKFFFWLFVIYVKQMWSSCTSMVGSQIKIYDSIENTPLWYKNDLISIKFINKSKIFLLQIEFVSFQKISNTFPSEFFFHSNWKHYYWHINLNCLCMLSALCSVINTFTNRYSWCRLHTV